MQKLFDQQHELGRALLTLRPGLMKAAGFSFAINVLLLVPSIYMLQVYDRVLTSRNGMTLIMLTLLTVALFVLFGVLDAVRARMLLRIGAQFEHGLKDRVFNAAFQRNVLRAGGSPAQAVQDVASLRQFIAGPGALAFFDAPWLPLFLVVIFLVHPWLGLFSLAAAAVLLALAWFNELLTHQLLKEAGKDAIASLLYANNNLRNAETIVAMGMLDGVRSRWAELNGKASRLQLLAGERGASIGSVSKVARMLFQSLILGLGAWLAMDDLITPGGMIAASILMGRALAPVEHLIGAWKQWINATEAHVRLVALLDSVPVPAPALPLPAPLGHVAIENVSAVPPGAKVPVLKGLSLRIAPGDVVAILGASGAGKSSLARLLTGIWPAASGHVRLDGADVFSWDKRDLGRYVGYLPQEIALFEGSVAENIARLGPIDPDKVVMAARLAGVHELILHLPKGYETPVGTDGCSLSAGQRQRIALARALYGEPRLVILDEPNSNLDEAGEAALIAAIRSAKERGATVVFIAHGSSLLAAADKLLVINDGTLVAYGPRDKVLEHLQSQQQGRLPA